MPYSEEKDSLDESNRQGPYYDTSQNKSTILGKLLTLASIGLFVFLQISLIFTIKHAIVCYQIEQLPPKSLLIYSLARESMVFLTISLLAGIVSYISFTIWLYICYKKATKLEPAIFRKSSFKILWSSLIPGINFFYQYQCLSDLWQIVQNYTNNRILRNRTTMQILFSFTLFTFFFTLADLFVFSTYGVGPLLKLSIQLLLILSIAWTILILLWQILILLISKGLRYHSSPRKTSLSPNNLY